jgi:exopolyphosphatase/guanosine-5'-triphosphate,3'-diphosphate pyrophosphatase
MASPNQSSDGRIVSFIDIGTNSVRLLLVRINSNQSYATITQQKEVVRLGEGEFIDQYLQPEAMNRAVLVCRKFVELSQSYGAKEIIAIATSATREAKNQAEFLRHLRREAQLDVRVVSSKEEARLVYVGMSSGVHLGNQQALFMDIGGGSTEVIAGDQHQHHYLDALKLGAIRLTSIFFLPNETEPVASERYALLQRYVRNASVRAVQQLKKHKLELAFGSSGTIENLADIAARAFHDRPRKRDDVLTAAELKRVVEILCALPLEERRQVPGINPERADIIISGAAILDTLLEELGLSRIHIVSERGVREGLLMDYLSRSEHAHLVQGMSVRERSVLQLARACNFDEPHARNVARLALEMFDSAREAGLHSLDERDRELLEYTALLHDVGAFISYSNHHVHTYYLIRNADLLGFDQTEIAVMAAAAFFHRMGLPNEKHAEFAELDKRLKKSVRVMSMLLRLAESLDRSHSGIITHARLRAEHKNYVVLEIQASQDCQLELWGVQDREKAVEKVLGRKMKLEVNGSDLTALPAAP